MDTFSFFIGVVAGFGIAFVVYFLAGLWLAGRMAIAALLITAAPLGAQTVVATVSPRHSVEIKTTSPVSVAITGNPSPRPRDYVITCPASTPIGKEDFTACPWKYLNDKAGGIEARPAAGLAAGIVTFVLTKPGLYEARLYRRPDADTAPHVFLKSFPVVVVYAPIEITGVELDVVRKPDSSTDNLSLVIESGRATLTASASSPVTVGVSPVGGKP